MSPNFKIEIENADKCFSWNIRFGDDSYFGEDSKEYIMKVSQELLSVLQELYKKKILSHSPWLEEEQKLLSDGTSS
mgnify:CR=1 FL=1